jgi:hypothetical protein
VSEAPGGDDRHRVWISGRQLTGHSVSYAVHLGGETVDDAGLKRLDRVLADHVRGLVSSTFSNWTARLDSASTEISMSDASTPPTNSPLTVSKFVVVLPWIHEQAEDVLSCIRAPLKELLDSALPAAHGALNANRDLPGG